ncbi:MAG: c-type cytochrome [Pirellulaceae bacterium]|nr:c-type cytochrome [Pirellulaceae bacterium]
MRMNIMQSFRRMVRAGAIRGLGVAIGGLCEVLSSPGGVGLTPSVCADDSPAQVDLQHVDRWLKDLPVNAQRGYRHLTETAYVPADLDDEVFDVLTENTKTKPAPFPPAHVAPELSVERAHAFLKYGLTERPGDGTNRPLQYVVDSSRQWTMNCFSCHGGSVYGRTLPGAPNNLYMLQMLTEDSRSTKLRLGKPLAQMDIGSAFMPLGTTVGTTNAVMFGVALMNYRDAELNVQTLRAAPRMVHHDMDPPAWWLFHRKTRLYADGFAEKGARGLMQFMLVRENGPDKFKQWENDFEDVCAFIESVRPPKYPGSIDPVLSARGRLAFNEHCASCHGTYGAGGQNKYPEKLIPIEEIGTDRVRLDSLTPKHREHYGQSWFAHFGKQQTWSDPQGYMAPPLDGIWASPPYLHNGSVPTLWHLLHPDQRPVVWTRTSIEMDPARIGLTVQELDDVPAKTNQRQRRQSFDTRGFGKGNGGHEFPNLLTEEERAAVLEYLKTL